jgi:hypothetical protein
MVSAPPIFDMGKGNKECEGDLLIVGKMNIVISL